MVLGRGSTNKGKSSNDMNGIKTYLCLGRQMKTGNQQGNSVEERKVVTGVDSLQKRIPKETENGNLRLSGRLFREQV